ncbi:MAG: hypothetical protein ABMA13_16050 [Chthoniobacteraceae bacterium]
MRQVFLAILISLSGSGLAREFDVRRDTFAFANETVFQYGIDERGDLNISRREKPPEYAHRCFVMARAVMQFWQFARFEPRRVRLSREEYAALIRRISRVPVWSDGPSERIVVPGFRDLREFSEVMPGVLQENLGAWLPTYLRVGNYRMAMGHLRAGQAAAARWLAESMDEGKLRGIYIARFPSLNHCLVAYRVERRTGGDLRFWLYDPNYPAKPCWLDYRAAERSFDFEPRWYFAGGRVNVMRVYISPFH